MSLHDIMMERAAIHFNNEMQDTPADAMARTVTEELNKQRQMKIDAENSKKALENTINQTNELNKRTGKIGSGGVREVGSYVPEVSYKTDASGNLIPSVSIEQVKPKSASERKAEMDIIKTEKETVKQQTLDRLARGEINTSEANKISPEINASDILEARNEAKVLGNTFVDSVQQPSKEGNVIIGGVEMEPTGADEFGNVKGYQPVKPSAAQDKRNVEMGELEGQIKNLISSFREAQKESKSVPFAGEQGIAGRIGSQAAIAKGKLGYSSSLNVYQDRIKAFSTTVAKAAGEVRPTDEDIKRFIKTLPTISKNDKENEIVINGLVNDLRARGAKAVWAERTGKLNINENIFNSVEEAEAAGLPIGTRIFINDREAVIE